jgi:hypothetical protein
VNPVSLYSCSLGPVGNDGLGTTGGMLGLYGGVVMLGLYGGGGT